MERVRHRGREVVLGLLLAAAMVATVVVVWESFSGAFSDKITVTAQLASAGDSLESGDIVTYRNVIVGEVGGASGDLDGSAVATLRIDPGDAQQIPANVTAVAVPASLFGNTKIELLPVRTPVGHLVDNATIAADRSPAAESLQTALSNVYTLLTSVHPAQLDVALSALATALDGQGRNLNVLIGKADAYLRALAPHLPELQDVIRSLSTVTREIARNTPALLQSVRNLLVLAKGILRDKQAVTALLDVGPGALDRTQRFLSPTTVSHIVTVVTDQVPVTSALAANPSALARTIDGFKKFADTFNQTLADGPYLKANILLTGADFAQLTNTAAGQKGNVFHAIVNPPRYTREDCPRYDGASGPNCGGGVGTNSAGQRVLTTGSEYGGSVASVGSPDERRAAQAAAGAITGVPPGQIPDAVALLLLAPFLRGSTTLVSGP